MRTASSATELDDDLKLEEVVAELQKTFVPFFVIPEAGAPRGASARGATSSATTSCAWSSPGTSAYVTAGAILVLEGRATDMAQLTRMLKDAGMPDARTGAVIRALTPLAEGAKGNGGPA